MTSPMTSTLRVVLLLSLLVASPALARARHRSTGLLDRTDNPIATFRASVFSGLPDLLGASVAVTMLRPLEVEVGISTAILASSFYARAGVALPLIDSRGDSGAGFTLNLPMLAGYRYFETLPFDTSVRLSGVNIVVGLEAVLWLSPHFGFAFQGLGGGSYWLNGAAANGSRLLPDLRLSAGLAF